MTLEALKASGKETFITFRMNDVHNPTDADQWNTPRVRREHPDCIVGQDDIDAGKGGWMAYCMDYGRPEVRQYILAIIQEMVELYGDTIDGLQLDWMRFPRHLSGTPDEVWAKRQVITDFMAEVRAILARAKRPILLAARTPTTPPGWRTLGFDVAEWVRQGLLDFLVVCPFLSTEWQIPVAPLRQALGQTDMPIYAGFDFGFGRQAHFPESLRGICSNLYDGGADGVYIFNFPCWVERLAARPYHWLAGLEDSATAAAKPLLVSIDHSRHRVAGVDQAGVLPVALPAGESIDLELYVPAAALPAWRAMLLTHSGGDVALAVNGQPARESSRAQHQDSCLRTEIFLEFADQFHQQGTAPEPADCRTFRPDPEALRPGVNQLRITNGADAELTIDRINLALW